MRNLLMRFLKADRPGANVKNGDGSTPLIGAASEGHL